jgi:hypothetical protein
MVMVRQSVLLLVLSVAFCAQARAANPDCDRFKSNSSIFEQQMSEVAGCSQLEGQYARNELIGLGYWLDTPGGEESPILSAYYVVRTLDADRIQDAVAGYVSSGYDARRLDAKKVEAEIVARKLSPESATNIRAMFKKAQERKAWLLNGLKTFEAPGYDLQKLFTDIPEAAAVAWEKFYQDHKDVYDLGTSIEKQMFAAKGGGDSVVDVKGCDDMHKSFKKYIAATQKGKLPPEITQFLQSDPLAFAMVSGLAECDGLRGFKVDAAAEYGLIADGRMWRGPRNAAYWAALASAKDEESRVHQSAPIAGGPELKDQDGLQQAKKIFKNNYYLENDPQSARVAAMKKLGDGWVELTFKVDKWMEPIMECVDVKPLHFNHWGQNGQPVWDWKCHVSGYEEKTNEVKPHAFSETSVEGVKPGMLVKMQLAQGDKPKAQAFPLEVSIPAKTKKDKPKLIGFSGIALQ